MSQLASSSSATGKPAANGKVVVDPPLLYFPAPHTRPVKNIVYVTNHSNESLAIKVKSTAPSRYFVTPKRFVLNPGQKSPLSVDMPTPVAPVTAGKRDVFQLECRPVPAGKVGSLDEIWDTLPAPTAVVTVQTDPTPNPPKTANLIYSDDAKLSEAPSAASFESTRAVSESAPKTPSNARQQLAALETDRLEALRRKQAAQAEGRKLTDDETVLEAQREDLLSESRTGGAPPGVRLSVVIFAMLSCYLIGMLLSRGWPRVPAA